MRQLDAMTAAHVREMDGLRDQTRANDKAHDRELNNLRENFAAARSTLDLAHATQIDNLKQTISQQNKELDRIRTALEDLRNKKDQSLPEQLAQIAQIRDLLGEFGGGGGEEKEKSTLDKMMDVAGPLLGVVAQKVAQGQEAQAAQQTAAQQAALAQRQARIAAAQRAAATAQQAAQAAQVPGAPAQPGLPPKRPQAPTEPAAPVLPPLDENDVRNAITFIDAAYAAQTKIEDLAHSAVSFVPNKEVLRGLAVLAPEDLVSRYKIEGNLATIDGRRYLKTLGRALQAKLSGEAA
jgi:multidrug efflux pump subunit AcrA (membrane-fusion protein)